MKRLLALAIHSVRGGTRMGSRDRPRKEAKKKPKDNGQAEAAAAPGRPQRTELIRKAASRGTSAKSTDEG